MKRKLLALAILLALPVAAFAYLDYPDVNGNRISTAVSMWLNPAGQAVPVSAGNPEPVGSDSGSAPVQTATPANSSHAAGVSIGGLFTIPAARLAGGGGVITSVLWTSTGGSVGQLLVRIWDKKPTNSTCQDNTSYVESATDDQHLIASPFVITPAAPANTTGDTNTYYNGLGFSLSYKNQDGTAGPNVYLCAVTVATDTADDNKPVIVSLTGPQD